MIVESVVDTSLELTYFGSTIVFLAIVSRFTATSLYHNGNWRSSVNFNLTVDPLTPDVPDLTISVEIPTPSNLLVKFSSL